LLAFVAGHKDKVEVAVAKPALITSTKMILLRTVVATGSLFFPILSIDVGEVAMAMLDLVGKGFEKDTFEHEDLVKIVNSAT
jgi:hypothetical protein